jgi:hypothetical protein
MAALLLPPVRVFVPTSVRVTLELLLSNIAELLEPELIVIVAPSSVMFTVAFSATAMRLAVVPALPVMVTFAPSRMVKTLLANVH